MLDLLRPIYAKTAAYGHFGRDEPEFTWEATDKVEALRDAAGSARAGHRGRQLISWARRSGGRCTVRSALLCGS